MGASGVIYPIPEPHKMIVSNTGHIDYSNQSVLSGGVEKHLEYTVVQQEGLLILLLGFLWQEHVVDVGQHPS